MKHVALALLNRDTGELTTEHGPVEGVDRLVVESEHVATLNAGPSGLLVKLSMAAPMSVEQRGDETVAVLGDGK